MDFSKPPHGLVTPMPPAKHGVPADEAEEMLITQPVLGPADPHRPTPPNPMTVQPPGIDASTSLAALVPSLSWAIGTQGAAFGWGPPDPPRHPQTQIRCNGLVVSCDTELAEIVELLIRNRVYPVASCCQEENGYGYVMMELDASQEFLRFWKTYMKPQGWELPALSSFELRNEPWRRWMNERYPPPVPFGVDEHGHTYTACWSFPAAQLAGLRGPLCDALGEALRSRRGGRWSWAAALPRPIRQG